MCAKLGHNRACPPRVVDDFMKEQLPEVETQNIINIKVRVESEAVKENKIRCEAPTKSGKKIGTKKEE